MAPRSARAMTEMALGRPSEVSVVPSMGSTAMSTLGSAPSPMCSPLKSMGASSFSPSPMTTIPSMEMVLSTSRMASTAAPSAASLSPRPIQRPAAMAAASVTRTSSMARLRSGGLAFFTMAVLLEVAVDVRRTLPPSGRDRPAYQEGRGAQDARGDDELDHDGGDERLQRD